MMFMNDYDISRAVNWYGPDTVAGRAARFLNDFREEVDAHSDGWAYWRAPAAAAKRLMLVIESGQAATEADLVQALIPIKSFYTRRGNALGMSFPSWQRGVLPRTVPRQP